MNITIVLDTHNETTPSFVLPGGDIGGEIIENNDVNYFLWIGIILFASAFYLKTRKSNDKIIVKDDRGELND